MPRIAKIVLFLAKIFFLCKNAFKWTIAQPSNQLGTIFRVRLKFTLNYHWNLYFCNANSVSLIQIYGNFRVTLKMVLNWFESCAIAHLKAFLQRKKNFARRSSILAFLSTLTDVVYMEPVMIFGHETENMAMILGTKTKNNEYRWLLWPWQRLYTEDADNWPSRGNCDELHMAQRPRRSWGRGDDNGDDYDQFLKDNGCGASL